jgi:hypothetical protein
MLSGGLCDWQIVDVYDLILRLQQHQNDFSAPTIGLDCLALSVGLDDLVCVSPLDGDIDDVFDLTIRIQRDILKLKGTQTQAQSAAHPADRRVRTHKRVTSPGLFRTESRVYRQL